MLSEQISNLLPDMVLDSLRAWALPAPSAGGILEGHSCAVILAQAPKV